MPTRSFVEDLAVAAGVALVMSLAGGWALMLTVGIVHHEMGSPAQTLGYPSSVALCALASLLIKSIVSREPRNP